MMNSLDAVVRRFSAAPRVALVYPGENDTSGVGDGAVLVIPPSDYWVRKAELGVQSEREALKYAPAIFELGEGYRYEAQKTAEGEYLLIAYEPAELRRKWFDDDRYSRFKSITFAQWVFGSFSGPYRLSSGQCLGMEEGIVVEIDPAYLSGNCESIGTFLREPHSVKTVPIHTFVSSELSAKTLKTTFIVLVVILLNLLAEGVMTRQSADQTAEQIRNMTESSSLPETSIERDAILQSLRKKEELQQRLRERIKKISALPIEASAPPAAVPAATDSTDGVVLIPGSKPGEQNRVLVGNAAQSAGPVLGDGMTMLSYDGSAITFVLQANDPDALARLKESVAKRFKKALITEEKNRIEVRIK